MVAPTEVAPRTGAAPRRTGAPLPLAAAVAALWAAIVGFVPVLGLAVLATIGEGASVSGAVRIGAGAWLLGHGVPVATPTDRVTLVPLAVTAWVGWRLMRAGVHASRAIGAHRTLSPWPAVRAGLAVAAVYAGLGAGVAVLVATTDVAVSAPRAAVTFGLLGAALTVGGALQHARGGQRLARRVPRVLSAAVRAGTAAVAFLFAAGAAAAGLALALSGGEATQMLAAFQAGVAGQVGITVLCLAYLPNLAIWGAAYLVGPGFTVGLGTVVSPGDVLLGLVPALPVFAALPSGPLSGPGPALLGVPVLAGIGAGLLLGRPTRAERPGEGAVGTRWAPLLVAAGLAGPVAGLIVWVGCVASRGGLGSGRLAELGPSDGRIPLLAGAVITVGTVVGAVVRRSMSRARR